MTWIDIVTIHGQCLNTQLEGKVKLKKSPVKSGKDGEAVWSLCAPVLYDCIVTDTDADEIYGNIAQVSGAPPRRYRRHFQWL